ncbi:NUDIX domain-containing protein [Patescibacteria group bacterium]|nr:NUDIX domain-containing protein [Patescibacteria group bacterium]
MQKRARAVIIKDKKILLIKRTKNDSFYWVISGGAVEESETNEKALKRECKEELGVDIQIKELLLEVKSQKPETKSQKEYFYLCDIVGGVLGSGNGPEFQKNSSYYGNYDIEWRNINDLKLIDLKPEEIRDLIRNKYKN